MAAIDAYGKRSNTTLRLHGGTMTFAVRRPGIGPSGDEDDHGRKPMLSTSANATSVHC